ncbi:LOW QUALITY PROTEIN: DNA excision repair protein ERCC-6-like [Pecten maximus]|uniref:LOW QUALITY PROTEIN: DNA excision repair protein ERCC-6-like n=1 Tax=Pecten maximus TaxID=6579 RepID=UPI001458134A|nr:LOW QUALITY PROTEIN: DNA excision repair protein ERCC-6-like [Pecten maximus]
METALKETYDRFNNIQLKDEPDLKSGLSSRVKEDSDTKENVKPRTESQEDLGHDEQVKFNRLVTKASQLASEGQVRMALELNKRALKIHHKDKLVRRIQKMEAYLEQYGDGEDEESEEEDDNGMVLLGKGFYLYRDLYNKLYDHQKAGVLWFWSLFKKHKGGILGDDMGLGKTIQMIAFLSGLFDMDKVHAVLIVMPVSLITNWEKEFKKWAPGIRVTLFHGSSKREKERALAKVQRRGGVCLTSYGLVVTSSEQLSQRDRRDFEWDYMILDEGHKIKNPTKTTKGVHAIGAKNRIVLTGTPVQNNLKELWALFDFVHKGTLLGTARTFKMEYDTPITRARERDATAGERKLGMMMADSLKQIIAPYFLRRTKAEVAKKEKTLDDKTTSEDESGKECKQIKYGDLAVVVRDMMPTMTRKNDFIVWLFLTRTQQQIYQDFLSLDSVKELLMTKKSPLVALTVLKKITDHPRLLSKRACAQLGLDGEDAMDNSLLESEEGLSSAATEIHNIDDSTLINESGKLIFIIELLTQLKAEGHRTLIFSQSRKILDIIDKVTTNRGHKVMRLDGTVIHICERDQRIHKFQTDTSYTLFLLTTQVGGVGLTLTAADRVIIFDPSWNPATDAQAVDRVFRIGQDKNVVIYRLITCGTVEEKIYRRQVFKDSITRQTTGNTKNPYRYFTKQELKELFILDNPHHSKTQVQLQEMHHGSRISDTSLDTHIAFLHSLDLFGLSDHDLMFNKASEAMDDQPEDQEEPVSKSHLEGNDYIQHRVQKAQQLLQMESELGEGSTLEERFSKYPRPATHRELPQFNFGSSVGPSYPLPGDVEPERKYKVEPDSVDLTTVESPDQSDNSTGDSDDPIVLDASTDDLEVKDIEEKIADMSIQITEPPEEKHEVVEIDSDLEEIQSNQDGNSDTEEWSKAPEKKDSRIPVKHEDITDIKQEAIVSGELNLQQNSSIKTEKLESSPNKGDNSDYDMGENDSIPTESPVKNCSSLMETSMTKTPDKRSMEENGMEDMTTPNSHGTRTPGSLKKKTPVTMAMTTPKGRNNKRKSVSHSPWLSRTPKSGKYSPVVNEEIFISPDASRPIVKVEPKPLSSLFSNMSDSNTPKLRKHPSLNTTIFSAFSTDSPDVQNDSSEFYLLEIPPEIQTTTKPDMTVVVNSSEDEEEESAGSTPDVTDSIENSLSLGRADVVAESDEEDSPDEPVSHNSSIDSVPGDRSSHNRSVDSPLPTITRQKKVRKAVIESSDEEGSDEHSSAAVEDESDSRKTSLKISRKNVIESSDEDENNEGSEDEKQISTKKLKKHTIKSSEDEMSDEEDTNLQSKKSVKRFEDVETDDESDEEDSDMSGFINDEDEESGDESDYSEEGETSEEEEETTQRQSQKSAFDRLSEDMKVMYKELIHSGRSLLKSGQYEEALANVLQAIEICPEPSAQALALTIHRAMDT